MLRKHEEEVVLVKSDQKRKITGLQDVINRLRQRVAECHRNIEKDEGTLQAQNADIRRDPKTYAKVIEKLIRGGCVKMQGRNCRRHK